MRVLREWPAVLRGGVPLAAVILLLLGSLVERPVIAQETAVGTGVATNVATGHENVGTLGGGGTRRRARAVEEEAVPGDVGWVRVMLIAMVWLFVAGIVLGPVVMYFARQGPPEVEMADADHDAGGGMMGDIIEGKR